MSVREKLRRLGKHRGVRYAASLPERLVRSASALAPLLRLSYWRMLVMALPYTITVTAAGFVAVVLWL